MKSPKRFCCIVFLLLVQYGSSDYFTSTEDLGELIHIQDAITTALEKYINAESEKLNSIKRFADMYKQEQRKASENVEQYIFNPLNAYFLIKRLSIDLEQLKTLMNVFFEPEVLDSIAQFSKQLPTKEDLQGAADGIARLQATYMLNVSDLAQGKIHNFRYSSQLTASDCFELASEFYVAKYHDNCYLWLQEAKILLESEKTPTVAPEKLVELFELNELERMNHHHTSNENGRPDVHQSSSHVNSKQDETIDSDAVLYNQLCREGSSNPAIFSSAFKCSYKHFNNPFLLIAPFKNEEIFDYPHIQLFHDVVSDQEINSIKQNIQSSMARATIVGTEGSITSRVRISKSAFLHDTEFEKLQLLPLSKRMNDMTGLDSNTAEALQVVNYGIGGHYSYHHDYLQNPDVVRYPHFKYGNRITTALLYMTDVLQGGATVFPKLRLSISPRKGTALVWNNLHASGDGNDNTLHGGCPVLLGSKWIFTRWFHEFGNEFLRPCTSDQYSVNLNT